MSSTISTHAGDRLKAVRDLLGKSQAEMAALLHLSLRGYQNYERGEREVPRATLLRAQDHIGLNPEWVTTGAEPMWLRAGTIGTTGAAEGSAAGNPPSSLRDFSDRYREVAHVVDAVLASRGLQANRLLYEALKTVVFAHGVSEANLALLVAGIEQQGTETQR